MKIIITSIILVIAHLSVSQNLNEKYELANNSSSKYIFTDKHELIQSNNIKRSHEKGKLIFNLEGQKWISAQVLFYQDQLGMYANVGPLGEKLNQYFATRIDHGKLNLYELYTTHRTWKKGSFENGSSTKQYFISTDFQPLKEASYSHLKQLLANEPSCHKYLDKYAAIESSQIVLDIIGASLAGLAIYFLGNDIEQYGYPFTSVPVFGLSGSMFVLKKIRFNSMANQLKKAVMAYNKI